MNSNYTVSSARGPRQLIKRVFVGSKEEAEKRYERESDKLRSGGVVKLFDEEFRLVAKAGDLAR